MNVGASHAAKFRRFAASVVSIVCLVSAWPVVAQTEAWNARYNGPGNSTDIGSAIAVDPAGNTFVTGYSTGSSTNLDYATIKYDVDGSQVWLDRYDSGASNIDVAIDVAADASGNAYVIGYSYGGATYGTTDFATIKYAPGGGRVWVNRYNGPLNSAEEGRAIALDSSGNIHVTGWSAGTGWDYATVKYNPAGTQQWARAYVGPSSDDYPHAITCDGSGNVFVAGYSFSGSSQDYATVKYDASGNQQWARRYHAGFGDDLIQRQGCVATDAVGNSYITGSSEGNGTGFDYATIKYDSAGSQAWVARYNGPPGGNNDFAYAVGVDGDGNVYVTGKSHGGSSEDYTTIKYNSGGAQQWVARHGIGGDDIAYALALDGDGNIYVTGVVPLGGPTERVFGTVKYNPSGTEVWAAYYDGPVSGANDYGQDIAVDVDGNVHVTGNSPGSGSGDDYATVMYRQCLNQTPDCNGNNVLDACDIGQSTSQDCNTNGVPDECDLAGPTSDDCDASSVPDECEGPVGNILWVGDDGEIYDTAANWNPPSVPVGGATAVLSNSGALENRCVLPDGGTTGVCALVLEASGSGRQILEISATSILRTNNGVSIHAGGEIDLRGGEISGAAITNASNTITGYGRISADLLNQGQVTVTALRMLEITGDSLDNANGGTLRLNTGASLDGQASSLSQAGEIQVWPEAAAVFAAPLVNSSGGMIRLMGGTLDSPDTTNDAGGQITGFGNLAGNLTNEGEIVVIADMQIIGDLTNNGTIFIQNGILTITGDTFGSGVIIGGFGG